MTITIVLAIAGVLLLISLTRAELSKTPLAAPAPASAGGNYTLDWYTVDGGGGTSSSASFGLSGTIGQPDASVSSGGSYTLAGGFWPGAPSSYRLRVPLVKR
jgi:hypothetical protein